MVTIDSWRYVRSKDILVEKYDAEYVGEVLARLVGG